MRALKAQYLQQLRLTIGASSLGLSLALSGCPDTTIPTLSGVRSGRVCSLSELEAWRDLSTAPERDELWVAFVDVGQGDAIWIRTPGTRELDAKDILIDAGNCLVSRGLYGGCGYPSNVNDDYDSDGVEALITFMRESAWPEGSPIDLVVATHPDKDHYGGLWRILQEYQVRAFISSGIPNDDTTYTRAMSAVAAEGLVNLTPVSTLGLNPQAFGELSTESWGRNVRARLLSADQQASDDNDASVVISLEFQGIRLLLTGDAEERLDQALLSADDARIASGQPSLLRSDVLKAGHHGGRGTNSQALLDRVLSGPRRYAVISAGQREQLPAEDTVERLREKVSDFGLYRTDRLDEGESRAESPGDDHILMRVSAEGDLTLCYAYQDAP